MSTIIVKNQTAGDLPLTRLSAPDSKIPASSQVTLTDYNKIYEVQNDAELLAYIDAGSVIINDGTKDLTKAESINYVTVVTTTSAPSFSTTTVTTGGTGNVGKLIALDVNGKLEGRIITTDGSKLDGIASGATNTPLTSAAPVDITKDTAAVGDATTAARANHKHDISTAAPSQGIGGGNNEGSGTALARAGHDHKIRETGGPTDLTVGVVADGQSLKRSGTAIVGYTPTSGTDEKVKVTASDTTTSYLNSKLAAGTNVSLTVQSPGLNETLQISGPAYGSTGGTVCQGNDSRLSDARTPTAHATVHKNGGGDEVATTTAAANAIPKAGSGGKLAAGWIDDTAHGNLGGGSLHSAATNSSNGFMSSNDRQIIDNVLGTVWESGLAITAHSPNNQTVDYTSGVYWVGGTKYTIAAGGVYDLTSWYASLASGQRAVAEIYVDSAQTLKSVLGTPVSGSSKPQPPTHPSSSVSLAYVTIGKAGNGTPNVIKSSDIVDTRLLLSRALPASDELVKVSSTDTTSGYLSTKLTAGTNVTLTPQNSGADETLQASIPAFGSAAGTICQGNDSRLSDARTPTAHATSHKNGGGDEVATATAAANAIPKAGAGGTLATGWIPDLSGTYQVTSAKGSANGYAGLDATSKVPTLNLGGSGADNTKFLRGDQTWAVPGSSSSGQKVIDLPITMGTDRWFSTSSGSYTLADDMIFRGSTVMGTPINVKVLAWVDSGATCAIRVYDVTNAQVICAKINITNITKAIVDLGVIANIPNGEAIWEVQIYKVSGGGSTKVYISSAQFYF